MTAKERPAPILASDVLQRLRERYRVTALATIDGLRTAAAKLGSLPASSQESLLVLTAIRDRLHQLRGSAGSYGLADASRVAGESEERLARWMSDPTVEADEREGVILGLANALEAAVMER
jgi:hypothetical protein